MQNYNVTQLADITQWNVGAVVLLQFMLFTKWYASRVLIAVKFNYFITSLRGKNEVKVKFDNNMYNYNDTLVNKHHTLVCQCSSFATVHKVAPVQILI